MKKRILSFALVLVLMCAMSISVFAGYAFDSGYSVGGSGDAYCWGELTVTSTSSAARTGNSIGNLGLCSTVTTLYCLDSAGRETPYTAQGGNYVIVYGNSRGVRGGSHHLVSGATGHGAWSCTLYADAD